MRGLAVKERPVLGWGHYWRSWHRGLYTPTSQRETLEEQNSPEGADLFTVKRLQIIWPIYLSCVVYEIQFFTSISSIFSSCLGVHACVCLHTTVLIKHKFVECVVFSSFFKSKWFPWMTTWVLGKPWSQQQTFCQNTTTNKNVLSNYHMSNTLLKMTSTLKHLI